MPDLTINIPIVEKSLDLVKDFLGTVLGEPAEQIGGLIADRIKYFRFKQQLDVLVKAQDYVKKKKIKTKNISLKNLVPLLDGAAIEEEQTISDMYAALLVNYIDADKNLKTNVYPYILSQISTLEVQILEDLSTYEYQIQMETNQWTIGYYQRETTDTDNSAEFEFNKTRTTYVDHSGNVLEGLIYNLIRLGLIVEEYDQQHENNSSTGFSYLLNAPKIQLLPSKHIQITQLGRDFLAACKLEE